MPLYLFNDQLSDAEASPRQPMLSCKETYSIFLVLRAEGYSPFLEAHFFVVDYFTVTPL